MLSWYNHAENPVWVLPKSDPALIERISKEFKIHPVIAQVLVTRGLTDHKEIHQFLYAKLPDLHDPFLMSEMPQAVERVCHAIKNKENILIYGDNDVDGMTGTALLTEFLRFVGANVFFYVTTRSTQRQSLIVEALEYAHKNKCRLLITVDCGITAANEIEQVVKENVDVIITDHHVPTDKIPNCVATLNPKLFNNPYPNKDLTGVGVAFKLAHGITNKLVGDGVISPRKVDLKRYLDLVALGTISDMGALRGENRILVRYGLKQLGKGSRVGLSKLMSLSDSNIVPTEITTFDIAVRLAPKLNSLGRIDDPTKGVDMLLIRNTAMAEKMAIEFDLNNTERQRIERLVAADVENLLLANPEMMNDRAVVLASENWHPGVIAIISTRISKYYHRPAVIISIENNIGKGSIRSIPEFPLLEVLKSCSDLLLNYGGHDFAAGLTINAENIPAFKERFIKAANLQLKNHDTVTKLIIDAPIKFEDISFDLMSSLALLEPYGNENPQPIFYCTAKQAWPPKVVGKDSLKLYLQQGVRMFEGYANNKAFLAPTLRTPDINLELVFFPQINNHQGTSILLVVRDFKEKESCNDSETKCRD